MSSAALIRPVRSSSMSAALSINVPRAVLIDVAPSRSGNVCTTITPLLGYQTAGVGVVEHIDALGQVSAVPYLVGQHGGGEALYAACISLTGEPFDIDREPPVTLVRLPGQVTVEFAHGSVRAWRMATDREPPSPPAPPVAATPAATGGLSSDTQVLRPPCQVNRVASLPLLARS